MEAAASRIRPMARRSRRSTVPAGGFSDLEIEGFPVTGDVDLTDSLLAEDRGHCLERGGLAVDHKGPPDRSAQLPHPPAELVPVSMGRVAPDGFHLGLALVLLPQNPNDTLPLLDPPA